eukprot:4777638-Alexandrium_andersonii.AAC.1
MKGGEATGEGAVRCPPGDGERLTNPVSPAEGLRLASSRGRPRAVRSRALPLWCWDAASGGATGGGGS